MFNRLFSLIFVVLIGFSASSYAKSPQMLQTRSALDECYAKIGDAPRTALASCLDRQITDAETELNNKIAALQKSYELLDSSGSAQAIASLLLSEQAFQLFSQIECQRVADATMGGSGAGDFAKACRVDLLRSRILALSDSGE